MAGGAEITNPGKGIATLIFTSAFPFVGAIIAKAEMIPTHRTNTVHLFMMHLLMLNNN